LFNLFTTSPHFFKELILFQTHDSEQLSSLEMNLTSLVILSESFANKKSIMNFCFSVNLSSRIFFKQSRKVLVPLSKSCSLTSSLHIGSASRSLHLLLMTELTYIASVQEKLELLLTFNS